MTRDCILVPSHKKSSMAINHAARFTKTPRKDFPYISPYMLPEVMIFI